MFTLYNKGPIHHDSIYSVYHHLIQTIIQYISRSLTKPFAVYIHSGLSRFTERISHCRLVVSTHTQFPSSGKQINVTSV